MKILHVISTMNPDFGGPVENIKLYCKKYQKFKSTGEVICSDSPFLGGGLRKISQECIFRSWIF